MKSAWSRAVLWGGVALSMVAWSGPTGQGSIRSPSQTIEFDATRLTGYETNLTRDDTGTWRGYIAHAPVDLQRVGDRLVGHIGGSTIEVRLDQAGNQIAMRGRIGYTPLDLKLSNDRFDFRLGSQSLQQVRTPNTGWTNLSVTDSRFHYVLAGAADGAGAPPEQLVLSMLALQSSRAFGSEAGSALRPVGVPADPANRH